MTDSTTLRSETAATVIRAEAKAPSSRGAPKWESHARERLKTALRRYTKPIQELVARDANEGDTRLLITDFLCDALGYDKYEDLTTEYQVKGEFADYGLRIDKELVAFVEAKRATTRLGPKHLRQVQMYAVNEGVEWLILTNGAQWQVYHLSGGLPVILDLAFQIDLIGPESPSRKCDLMFYLSKESFKRRQIDELWKRTAATSAKSLAAAILSEESLTVIRRWLKRSTGHSVPVGELSKLITETALRPECTESA